MKSINVSSNDKNENKNNKSISKWDMTNFRGYLWTIVLWLNTYTKNTLKFYKNDPVRLRKELLSGFTVSILQVPESVAFSYVAGVDPITGLYTTAFLGTITGLIGGRPAQISGAAGAMAVVLTNITSDTGELKDMAVEARQAHLIMAGILVGLFQTALGLIQVARFVSLIPESAMIGFMNGLAIIIGYAQMSTFKFCPTSSTFSDCKSDEYEWLSYNDSELWMILLIISLTMLVMHVFPLTPRIGKIFPASLIAVMVGTVFEWTINRQLIGADVRTVGDTATLDSAYPSFGIPDGIENWSLIFRFAASLSAIGLIESVMTLQAVDEITETPPSNFRNNQECVAQGIGNLVCGLFGSMPGDAMIGQSTINVMNGARHRMSAVTAGLFMFIIISVAIDAINIVPIAALTGVLFMVVIHTFNWETFRLFLIVPVVDSIGIVLVTVLAVWFDLAIAVVSGVVWTALCSSWKSGTLMKAHIEHDAIDIDGNQCKIYHIKGPLFFGSANQFGHLFAPMTDPQHVIIDFSSSMLCDFSAVAAIRAVSKRYLKFDKRVTLRHLCHASRKHMKRANAWVRGDKIVIPFKKNVQPSSFHESREESCVDEHWALGARVLSQAIVAPVGSPTEAIQVLADQHDIEVEYSRASDDEDETQAQSVSVTDHAVTNSTHNHAQDSPS